MLSVTDCTHSTLQSCTFSQYDSKHDCNSSHIICSIASSSDVDSCCKPWVSDSIWSLPNMDIFRNAHRVAQVERSSEPSANIASVSTVAAFFTIKLDVSVCCSMPDANLPGGSVFRRIF